MVYARHVADHEILLVAEVTSVPALVNCRASSPLAADYSKLQSELKKLEGCPQNQERGQPKRP